VKLTEMRDSVAESMLLKIFYQLRYLVHWRKDFLQRSHSKTHKMAEVRPAARKLKTRSTSSQSMLVPVSMLKLDYTSVTYFVDARARSMEHTCTRKVPLL